MRIYFETPDINTPVGGIKQIYRQVDILNRNSIPAFVLHREKGFRCTWFENQTAVCSPTESTLNPSDIVVFSEIMHAQAYQALPGYSKVIFNQNCYYSFRPFDENSLDHDAPYVNPDYLGTLVVSEDSEEYLTFAFPEHPIHRLYLGINPHKFNFVPWKKKKNQIAYMPRKGHLFLKQVLNILKYKKVLGNYELISIENVSEEKVAEILRESKIFLSSGVIEGFGLPPAEAMASGCLVIGFHARGGREYMKPEYCFPVEPEDVCGFSRAVVDVLSNLPERESFYESMAKKASEYILRTYSLENEEKSSLKAWQEILKKKTTGD